MNFLQFFSERSLQYRYYGHNHGRFDRPGNFAAVSPKEIPQLHFAEGEAGQHYGGATWRPFIPPNPGRCAESGSGHTGHHKEGAGDTPFLSLHPGRGTGTPPRHKTGTGIPPLLSPDSVHASNLPKKGPLPQGWVDCIVMHLIKTR